MAYIKLSEFVYDCNACHTRCDGISKLNYQFENDAAFSEQYEQAVIERINLSSKYRANKCNEKGYPDVEVRTYDEQLYHFVEIKVQQRTFMHVQKYLPDSNLAPSETVALNLSDLVRYFELEQSTGTPISILWIVLNRLCIVPGNEHKCYYQTCRQLKSIYEAEKLRRRFRRMSGEGDVVDGIHKGVTVNYHFSLKELVPWNF